MEFRDAAAWRAWLAKHGGTAQQAWVVHLKVNSKLPGLRYEEALEEALAFGWIDGMMRSLDKDRIMQRYTPRRPGSNWSKSNTKRAEELIKQGRMAEAGMAAIQIAKKNGKWSAI
jgi:uncharacterized protein YdeI (YjbR/CyaY-like superfamily)